MSLLGRFCLVGGVVSGYGLFETISSAGIVSRALIDGPSLALGWLLLLVFEVVYSRRACCRYVSPIGLTYGIVGAVSSVRAQYRLDKCFREGNCHTACLVAYALDVLIKGRAAA